MKWYKKVSWVLAALVGLFFLFGMWYKYQYSMEIAQIHELNSPSLRQKLLITTQGSEFKDSIVSGIANHYKSKAIFIKVIDISSLEDNEPADFDAILLIHTWEYGKPPESVQSFMDNNSSVKNKMVVVTTSGEGTEKMEGVDAITGESIIRDIPLIVEKVISKLDLLFDARN